MDGWCADDDVCAHVADMLGYVCRVCVIVTNLSSICEDIRHQHAKIKIN